MKKNSSFIIHGLAGEKKLRGTIRVNGAKNAALKAMAATILFDGPVTLENIPETADIATISIILTRLGATISEKGKGTIVVDASSVSKTDIDPTLAGGMRASVVLTGPLLARFRKVSFPAPGGCVIGARPIDLFIKGYEEMGAPTVLDEKACLYNIAAPNGLKAANIHFEKKSVGATETLMMAAVLGAGTTTLTNCALEPEIVNVAEWLNTCGADIRGVGTPTIEIHGTGGKPLSSVIAAHKPYVAIPDRIEAGSFLILGALCAEKLTIEDCRPDHLGSLIDLLKNSGVDVQTTTDSICVSHTSPTGTYKAFDVTTHEYPGFPTDLQSPLVMFLTQATGESRVVETIFEGRFKYVEDLIAMGAHIVHHGPQEVSVHGPTPLKELSDGRHVFAHDIRAGFAVVLAALCGTGKFTVDNVQLIDRGYERLEERLRKLGAKIERKS